MGNDLCPRRCLVRHALLAGTFALMRLRIAAKSVAQDHGKDPSLTHDCLSLVGRVGTGHSERQCHWLDFDPVFRI